MRRFLAMGVMAVALSGKALACDVPLPDHLRIQDCRLATAVADAARQSPTLNDLVERVGRANGLVYVLPSPQTGTASGLLGGLVHDVAFAGQHRMLRIFVSKNAGNDAVATLGHELRHALEVLEHPDAAHNPDEDPLDGVTAWRTSAHTIETQAALDAGHAIERELNAARVHSGSSSEELAS